MTLTEFSDHQIRQMLQAVRGWLQDQRRGQSAENGYLKLEADTAESLGSDFGLDKPSAHRLLVALIGEGYLDAECHTTDSEIAPLRYAEVRDLTDKALGKLS